MQRLEDEIVNPAVNDAVEEGVYGYPQPAVLLNFLDVAERYWREERGNHVPRRRGRDLALVNAGLGL